MCPKCGASDTVPIVHGMPGQELHEEELAGKVALGGCCIEPDSPDRQCKSCGHSWQSRATGDSNPLPG